MQTKYEYKCPDCNEFVSCGDKFCRNCSCKLDWDDEETGFSKKYENKSNEQDNITNDKYKILLFIFVLFVATMGIFIYLNNSKNQNNFSNIENTVNNTTDLETEEEPLSKNDMVIVPENSKYFYRVSNYVVGDDEKYEVLTYEDALEIGRIEGEYSSPYTRSVINGTYSSN